MKYLILNIALMIAFMGQWSTASNSLSVAVELAMIQAGDNAAQLRKALDEVPDNQAEGMRFLIAYMPMWR